MKNLLIATLILLTGCATSTAPKSTVIQFDPSEKVAEPSSDDMVIIEGIKLVSQGSPKKAIEKYFNPVIESCDERHKASKAKIYNSRGPTESLMYMVQAATTNESAVVQGVTCAQALYMKGYAYLEMGNVEQAEVYVKRALELSPSNSLYLSEMGHINHVHRNWDKALEFFLKAEDTANAFSPDEVKETELTRAIRGVGYSYIELGKLDEAEAKFREALKINKNDQGAQNELKYIKSLR